MQYSQLPIIQIKLYASKFLIDINTENCLYNFKCLQKMFFLYLHKIDIIIRKSNENNKCIHIGRICLNN